MIPTTKVIPSRYPLFVTDSRIHYAVQYVRHEVGRYDAEGDYVEHSLHHWEVFVTYRIEQPFPETVPIKDSLRNYGTAENESERQCCVCY